MDEINLCHTINIINELILECPPSELIDEIRYYLSNCIRLIEFWESYKLGFNEKNELYIILNYTSIETGDKLNYQLIFPNITGNCTTKSLWKKGF